MVERLTKGMSAIAKLSPAQLRRAASLKEKIAALQSQIDALLGASAKPTAVKSVKKKRKMSVAGRARIIAAQKARWAKIRAAKKK
jgi:hypothetical protein